MLSMTSPSSNARLGFEHDRLAALRLQFHPHIAVAIQGHRLLAVVEVAVLHGRHVGARRLGELAHAVRVLARVLLDGVRGAAVRVAFAQNRVDCAAQNLAVALLERLLLVGLRMRRIVRERIALFLKLLDGGGELRYRGADVRQLDDVGLGHLGQLAELGEVVRHALLFGQLVGELGQDARRHGNVGAFDVDPRRLGEGPNDRQKGVSRKQRRLVGQRVDDGRLLIAHVVVSRPEVSAISIASVTNLRVPKIGTFAPCPAGVAPAQSHRDQPTSSHNGGCDILLVGHERQRQAPACWPATLQPRWGAPGDDQVE